MEEALYVVEFGDVHGGPSYRNGGVIVLETGRIFGGDSSYYYVGTYTVKENLLNASARIVKHNDLLPNVFGDNVLSFEIKLQGRAVNDTMIEGTMKRTDRAGVELPVRLTMKERLP